MNHRRTSNFRGLRAAALTAALLPVAAGAVPVTDPNDARTWQGASVGTFAQLYFGADTLANRQLVVDFANGGANSMLDDGIFSASGFTTGSLLPTAWATGGGGGCLGVSSDTTGTGSLAYSCSGSSVFTHANSIDNLWFQSSRTIGDTVFDLGFQASKAAVFNSIDHGPLPQEAIESTVYLSNDLVNWTQAVVERVWLEGFQANLGIQWDGFVYAVGTGSAATFRYASVTAVGPGALLPWFGTDDEINGVMGLRGNFTPVSAPEPSTLGLLGMTLLLGGFARRRR